MPQNNLIPQDPTQLDPKVVKVMSAIKKIESGGDYNAVGDLDRGVSRGAYQFNKDNFKNWATEYGLDPNDFSPANQNKVAYARIKKFKDEGKQPEEIAALWNGAKKDANGRYTYINPEYGVKFRAALGTTPSSAPTGFVTPGTNEPKQGFVPTSQNDFSHTKLPEGKPTEQPNFWQSAFKTGQNVINAIEAPFVGLAAAPVQLLAKSLGQPDPFANFAQETGGPEVSKLGVKEKLGDAAQVGSYFVPGGGGLLAQSLKMGGAGALQGAGQSMSKGGDASEIALSGALGGAIGAPFGAVGSLATKGVLPRLLSSTTERPIGAFEKLAENPKGVLAAARDLNNTQAQLLTDIQGGITTLRKNLTKAWERDVDAIVKEYSGVRVGLPEKVAHDLKRVAEDFSLTLPQNIKNLSSKEMTELLTEINSVPRKYLENHPKGAIVRSLKDDIKNIALNAFGGKEGPLAALYSNYSVAKGVHDAADELFRAYRTNSPNAQTAAQAKLRQLFNENKPAYMQALKDLEDLTGQDFTTRAAGQQFASRAPNLNIQPHAGFIPNIINILQSPLSSPRLGAHIATQLPKFIPNEAAIRVGRGAAGGLLGSLLNQQPAQ